MIPLCPDCELIHEEDHSAEGTLPRITPFDHCLDSALHFYSASAASLAQLLQRRHSQSPNARLQLGLKALDRARTVLLRQVNARFDRAAADLRRLYEPALTEAGEQLENKLKARLKEYKQAEQRLKAGELPKYVILHQSNDEFVRVEQLLRQLKQEQSLEVEIEVQPDGLLRELQSFIVLRHKDETPAADEQLMHDIKESFQFRFGQGRKASHEARPPSAHEVKTSTRPSLFSQKQQVRGQSLQHHRTQTGLGRTSSGAVVLGQTAAQTAGGQQLSKQQQQPGHNAAITGGLHTFISQAGAGLNAAHNTVTIGQQSAFSQQGAFNAHSTVQIGQNMVVPNVATTLPAGLHNVIHSQPVVSHSVTRELNSQGTMHTQIFNPGMVSNATVGQSLAHNTMTLQGQGTHQAITFDLRKTAEIKPFHQKFQQRTSPSEYPRQPGEAVIQFHQAARQNPHLANVIRPSYSETSWQQTQVAYPSTLHVQRMPSYQLPLPQPMPQPQPHVSYVLNTNQVWKRDQLGLNLKGQPPTPILGDQTSLRLNSGQQVSQGPNMTSAISKPIQINWKNYETFSKADHPRQAVGQTQPRILEFQDRDSRISELQEKIARLRKQNERIRS